MPRFEQLVGCLHVSNVATTAQWYAEVLGFECETTPDQEPFSAARLTRDGVEIRVTLHTSESAQTSPTERRSPSLSIRVSGIRDLHERLVRRALVSGPLAHRADGRTEFTVVDPDGTAITFFEPTSSAMAPAATPANQPAAVPAITRGSNGPAGFDDVADATSLRPGQCRTVEVRGRRFALCNVEGQYYAVDDACPHRGGPLGAGVLEGCDLYCPLHGWPFDVRTGACRTNPSRPVRTYPTRVENGKVWIMTGGD